MNNAGILKGAVGTTYAQAAAMTAAERGGMSATAYAAANAPRASMYNSAMSMIESGGAGSRGVAGNLLASSMGGKGTQYLGGYFRGALGFSQSAGLMGASEAGAKMAVQHLSTSFGTGLVGRGRSFLCWRGSRAKSP
jgi:hypothetical protein